MLRLALILQLACLDSQAWRMSAYLYMACYLRSWWTCAKSARMRQGTRQRCMPAQIWNPTARCSAWLQTCMCACIPNVCCISFSPSLSLWLPLYLSLSLSFSFTFSLSLSLSFSLSFSSIFRSLSSSLDHYSLIILCLSFSPSPSFSLSFFP